MWPEIPFDAPYLQRYSAQMEKTIGGLVQKKWNYVGTMVHNRLNLNRTSK